MYDIMMLLCMVWFLSNFETKKRPYLCDKTLRGLNIEFLYLDLYNDTAAIIRLRRREGVMKCLKYFLLFFCPFWLVSLPTWYANGWTRKSDSIQRKTPGMPPWCFSVWNLFTFLFAFTSKKIIHQGIFFVKCFASWLYIIRIFILCVLPLAKSGNRRRWIWWIYSYHLFCPSWQEY